MKYEVSITIHHIGAIVSHVYFIAQVPTDWLGTWNAADAKLRCQDRIRESGVSQTCEKINIDRDGAIQNCITDIQVG